MNSPFKVTPRPKRMTVIVPSVVNAVIRLRAEKHKVKPYYLVSAALALYTRLCSVCSEKLDLDQIYKLNEETGDLDLVDPLVRCKTCQAAEKVPDRVLARGKEKE